MPTLLQAAIDLAVRAHRDGEDPPGEPYIVHPMRVLLAVSHADDEHQDEALRCVAILHDTLERGGLKPRDLRKAGMPEKVIKAVKLLTHEEGVSYADYVVALKPDKLARAVKIADLMDNADLRRVAFGQEKLKKDIPRLVRYAASYRFLTDQINEKTYRQMMEQGES